MEAKIWRLLLILVGLAIVATIGMFSWVLVRGLCGSTFCFLVLLFAIAFFGAWVCAIAGELLRSKKKG